LGASETVIPPGPLSGEQTNYTVAEFKKAVLEAVRETKEKRQKNDMNGASLPVPMRLAHRFSIASLFGPAEA
jgi:hypothetical protein